MSGFDYIHTKINNIKEKIKKDPSNPINFYNIAEYYYLIEKNKALEYYEKALELDKNYADALFGIGKCYDSYLTRDKALTYYEKALILKPEHKECLLAIAEIYKNKKDPKAFEYYKRLIKLDSKNIKHLFEFIKNTYEYDYVNTLKYSLITNYIIPNNTDIINLIAYSYFNMSKYEYAVDWFIKELKLDSKDITKFNIYACYMNIKRYGESLKYIKELYGKSPENRNYINNLAGNYIELSDNGESSYNNEIEIFFNKHFQNIELNKELQINKEALNSEERLNIESFIIKIEMLNILKKENNDNEVSSLYKELIETIRKVNKIDYFTYISIVNLGLKLNECDFVIELNSKNLEDVFFDGFARTMIHISNIETRKIKDLINSYILKGEYNEAISCFIKMLELNDRLDLIDFLKTLNKVCKFDEFELNRDIIRDRLKKKLEGIKLNIEGNYRIEEILELYSINVEEKCYDEYKLILFLFDDVFEENDKFFIDYNEKKIVKRIFEDTINISDRDIRISVRKELIKIFKNIGDIKQILKVEIDSKTNIAHYTKIDKIKHMIKPIEVDKNKDTIKLLEPYCKTNDEIKNIVEKLTIDNNETGNKFKVNIRLCNVDNMNDPEEGHAFFDLIKDEDKDKGESEGEKLFKRYYSNGDSMEIQRSNTYLASFSTATDKLPLWVQYADDAKGCYFVVDDNFDFIDEYNFSKIEDDKRVYLADGHFNDILDIVGIKDISEIYSSKYVLYNVAYVDKDNKKVFINWQEDIGEKNILHFVKGIYENIKGIEVEKEKLEQEQKENINKIIVDLLDQIRFLFKSIDYEHEKELRVIKFSKEPLVDYNGIIPKLYLDMDKDIEIKEVVLGPKSGKNKDIVQYLYHTDKVKKVSKSRIKYE